MSNNQEVNVHLFNRPSFGLDNVDGFVLREIEKRKKNRSLVFNPQYRINGHTDDNPYKGNQSAWCRVTSYNQDETLKGFVMYGVNSFENIYGFQNSDAGTILGYDTNEKPHKILNTNLRFKHRPTPGVNSVDVEMMGGFGKFRKARINWTCWSVDQLNYLEKYFLLPTVSVSVEWGWNNFNPTSLLNYETGTSPEIVFDPKDFNEKDNFDFKIVKKAGSGLRGAWEDEQIIYDKIIKSNGNYDLLMGFITSFDIKLREDGGFDVTTEVSSKSILFNTISSLHSVRSESQKNNKKNSGSEINESKEQKRSIIDQLNDLSKRFTNNDTFNHIEAQRAGYVTFKSLKDKNKFIVYNTKLDSDENHTYITMKLLIAIVNNFILTKAEDSTVMSYPITIKNTLIKAHPNLKSTDGSVLLIPNKFAPSWVSDPTSTNNNIEEVSDVELRKHDLGEADKILEDIIKAKNARDNSEAGSNENKDPNGGVIKRVDLLKTIYPYLSSEEQLQKQFPSYDVVYKLKKREFENESSFKIKNREIKSDGYFGKLENLLLDINMVKNAFKTKDRINDALIEILRKISEAAGNIWDFDIRPLSFLGQNNSINTIVDRNFISPDSNFFGNLNKANKRDTWVMSFIADDSIIIDFDFNIKLSDAVAYQTYFGSNFSNSGAVKKNIFPNKNDMITGTQDSIKVEIKNPLNSGNRKENLLEALKLDEKIADEKYFLIKTKTEKYIPMVEPNKSLMSKIITLPEKSVRNENNGIMPGTEVTFSMLGISGFKFLDYIFIEDLPLRYSEKLLYVITKVNHSIRDNQWITNITARATPFPDQELT